MGGQRARLSTVAVSALLCCSVVLDAQAQPRPSQEFIVTILESPGTPANLKLRVLREITKIEPHDREPVLVNYIREEAARWQRYYDDGYQSWRDGKQAAVPETGNDDTERYPLIVGMLAQDHDPSAIPLLVGASHISLTAAEAAADFGEDALDEVIAVVNTDEHKARAATLILEMMVERKSVRKPLSAAARDRVAALIEAEKLRQRQELAVERLQLDQPMAHPEIHLIPAGYAGFVTIVFMAPTGEPGDFEGNARLYRIPKDGLLFTQSPPNLGLGPEWQFFLVDANGNRRPVKISSSTLDDTPQNRSHPDIEIFVPGRGSIQTERCNIEYDQYFIGTRAQFLDADSSAISMRLQEEFKCR